ncbi:MAG: UPF0175 family protein [Planctomycetota bacterium]
MPLIIPDEILQAAGLSENDALIEIACRLFDAGRLTLWDAARLARLSRVEIEGELLAHLVAAPPRDNAPVLRPSGGRVHT